MSRVERTVAAVTLGWTTCLEYHPSFEKLLEGPGSRATGHRQSGHVFARAGELRSDPPLTRHRTRAWWSSRRVSKRPGSCGHELRRKRSLTRLLVVTVLMQGAVAAPAAAEDILDLQRHQLRTTAVFTSPGDPQGRVALINVNPRINAWFILEIDQGPWGPPQAFHLENVSPATQTVSLEASGAIHLSDRGIEERCRLLPGETPDALAVARDSKRPYAPLCRGKLYLRNSVVGNATTLELATDFLRDHVWAGDQIIGFIKTRFLDDTFLERAELVPVGAIGSGRGMPSGAPPPALLGNAVPGEAIVASDLGIELEKSDGQNALGLRAGQWYPVRDATGVYLSAVQALDIEIAALSDAPRTTGKLDSVEKAALNYLVAFDLRQFDLGFALGTDHPRLGWSERTRAHGHDSSRLGPDGFDNAAPLVRTGMVSPALLSRTVATFTGGFKREHGAFEYGALASRDDGSYYGFIEQGVIFSSLEPGLATLYVLDDGTVEMKTWESSDDALLPRIRHARQNGVALLERDPSTGHVEAGRMVSQWAEGNWSGSVDEKQRTLRAGACIAGTPTQRFLVYGYFSAATPLLMAQVFKAYGCEYAMHLDMNALEHTYLAIYGRYQGGVVVEHLIQGMDAVDDKSGDKRAPRFLAAPDNRDFFYLLRRGTIP